MPYLDPKVSGKQENREQKLGHMTHKELAAYGQTCKVLEIWKGQRTQKRTVPGVLPEAQLPSKALRNCFNEKNLAVCKLQYRIYVDKMA